jgi:hypothetical protein
MDVTTMTLAIETRRYHRRMNKIPLVLLAMLAGCPGDDSIAIDDLPDALQKAECDFEVRCELVPDQATCVAALPFNSTDELTTIAGVKSGRIGYDGKVAKDCIDAFEGFDCSLGTLEHAVIDSCQTIFSGTVAVGGACVVSEECVDLGACKQTDPSCDASTACCAGTCAAGVTKIAIGGSCSSANNNCIETAYCDIPTGAPMGTCTALVEGEGTVCDASDACAPPRQCVAPTGSTTGACTTLPPEGQHCDPQSFFGCNDLRDYCDQTTSLCTHRVGVGVACEGSNGAQCIGFDQCDTTTSLCVARPSVGQACGGAAGLECLGDLACVNGTCTAQPAGMTCSL